ncbi:hypothetical protein BDV97DRAFT_416692 [Delphinella strobiligena]|nr:hypothetical protein BDV97DRAFT_416692 [Delphinella strobiligena]
MPTLKQLTCSIELGSTDVKVKEFGTHYGDGHVETFVPVPREEVNFSIHLTSERYIAPGIAFFVYIDGQYQCNRNRRGLVVPESDTSVEKYQVDLRVRQKESKQPGGGFIGRGWTFHELNMVSADKAPKISANFLHNIGTIEVVVLRCKEAPSPTLMPPTSLPLDGSHSAQKKKVIFHPPKKTETVASSSGGRFGDFGMGIFDGPADQPCAFGERLKQSQFGNDQPSTPRMPQVQTILTDQYDGNVPGIDVHGGVMHKSELSVDERPSPKMPRKDYAQFDGMRPLSSEDDRPPAEGPKVRFGHGTNDGPRQSAPFTGQYSYGGQPGFGHSQNPYNTGFASTQPFPSTYGQQSTGHPQGVSNPNYGQSGYVPKYTPNHTFGQPGPNRAQANFGQSGFNPAQPFTSTYKNPDLGHSQTFNPGANAYQSGPYGRPQDPSQPRPVWATPYANLNLNFKIPSSTESSIHPTHTQEEFEEWRRKNRPADGKAAMSNSGSKKADSSKTSSHHDVKTTDWGETSSSSKKRRSRKTSDPFRPDCFTRPLDSVFERKQAENEHCIRRLGDDNGDKKKNKATDGWMDESKEKSDGSWGNAGDSWGNDNANKDRNDTTGTWADNSKGNTGGGWDDVQPTNTQGTGWDETPANNDTDGTAAPQDATWGDDTKSKTASRKASSRAKTASGFTGGKQQASKNDGSGEWGDDSKKDIPKPSRTHREKSDTPKEPERRRHHVSRESTTTGSDGGPSSPRSEVLKPYFADWKKAPKSIISEASHVKRAKRNNPYIGPAEPLYPIPEDEAAKKGVRHQVAIGQAANYMHLCANPEYLDDMEHPYAIFRFKYRSRKVIEDMFDVKIKDQGESVKAKLAGMSRDELERELLQLKLNDEKSSNSARSMSAAEKVAAWKSKQPASSHRSARSKKSSAVPAPAADGWGGDDKATSKGNRDDAWETAPAAPAAANW